MDVKKIFGSSIRARRSQLGLSQEALAERADLHRTYISDVERGARNVSLLSIVKLADALEISVSALFPRAESEQSQPTSFGGSDPVQILLVEDNPDDVKMTLHAFQKSRFTNHVQVVGDGAEALDFIFYRGKYAGRQPKQHPQLILLDLNLPKLSGLEVLHCLKSDKSTRDIPVVVLTASQDTMDMAECQRHGAATYIVKPVDFQRLSRATPQLNLDWALLKPGEAVVGTVS